MREFKHRKTILALLLGLILLVFCLPIFVFAETSEISDGDEGGISLSTAVPPQIVSGDGSAYNKGDATGLTFTTDDSKENLLRVLVDGKAASPENYTVSGEPLAITLKTDFLDGLSAGTHTIEIVTENGSAIAKFTVKSKQEENGGGNANKKSNTNSNTSKPAASSGKTTTTAPKTGDESCVVWWLLCMSASVVALWITKRRKLRQK